jgi:hypothetical protein
VALFFVENNLGPVMRLPGKTKSGPRYRRPLLQVGTPRCGVRSAQRADPTISFHAGTTIFTVSLGAAWPSTVAG